MDKETFKQEIGVVEYSRKKVYDQSACFKVFHPPVPEPSRLMIVLDINRHLTYCVNSDESKLESEFMYL